jgi:hypothetical protein
LDGRTKTAKSGLAKKVLRTEIIMHSNYSEEHLKVQKSRRREDFWDKQGNVI